MEIDWSTYSSIKDYGFRGAYTVVNLRRFIDDHTLDRKVPASSGVYIVFRRSGGYFKGSNPNVRITTLEDEWVSGVPVIYIGRTSCLQRRIRQLIEFGRGKSVGHWGGRYMWQLADAKSLCVCWMVSDDYELLRNKLVDSFYSKLEHLPFANLRK